MNRYTWTAELTSSQSVRYARKVVQISTFEFGAVVAIRFIFVHCNQSSGWENGPQKKNNARTIWGRQRKDGGKTIRFPSVMVRTNSMTQWWFYSLLLTQCHLSFLQLIKNTRWFLLLSSHTALYNTTDTYRVGLRFHFRIDWFSVSCVPTASSESAVSTCCRQKRVQKNTG